MKQMYEFDEEIIDCALCNELLTPPIHQCQNGHMACADCSEKLQGKECPSCRAMPFAHSRSLGMEKMIESLRTTCVHAPHGCTSMVKLTEKEEHEDVCDYRQLKCPVPTCTYTGPKFEVPEHFKTLHNAVVTRFPQGIESQKISISWKPTWPQYILFVVGSELYLAHIHRVSLPVEESELQQRVLMIRCSSFGRDSYCYDLRLKVTSVDGVSSTSKLENALALNNQTTENIQEDKNLILLPDVNPRPEKVLSLQFTLKL